MAELDETRLIEKLRAIEALHARPGTDGERVAAEQARERILERLRELAEADPPVEYRFSMGDEWSRRVFVALLRRYDIRPYRYRRQRRTTVMARVSKRFVDETLWPEFLELSSTLRGYLDDVTERVIAQVIHADVSEASEVEAPKQLPLEAAAKSPDGGASAGAATSSEATSSEATSNATGSKPARSGAADSGPARSGAADSSPASSGAEASSPASSGGSSTRSEGATRAGRSAKRKKRKKAKKRKRR